MGWEVCSRQSWWLTLRQLRSQADPTTLPPFPAEAETGGTWGFLGSLSLDKEGKSPLTMVTPAKSDVIIPQTKVTMETVPFPIAAEVYFQLWLLTDPWERQDRLESFHASFHRQSRPQNPNLTHRVMNLQRHSGLLLFSGKEAELGFTRRTVSLHT